MTLDFIDDFSNALEKEKRGYLICVHRTGEPRGCHIRFNFDDWPEQTTKSKHLDALQAIAAGLSEDLGSPLLVLTEEQRQGILGALDSLAAALADHRHDWTEGEKALYEAAVESVKL